MFQVADAAEISKYDRHLIVRGETFIVLWCTTAYVYSSRLVWVTDIPTSAPFSGLGGRVCIGIEMVYT